MSVAKKSFNMTYSFRYSDSRVFYKAYVIYQMKTKQKRGRKILSRWYFFKCQRQVKPFHMPVEVRDCIDYDGHDIEEH